MDNSQGLIDHYVTKVKQLAAKHQTGESIDQIKVKVDEVLAEAHEHFAVWINGEPHENWAAFAGKLNFLGHSVSDRSWADVLAYAGETVKDQEPPQRKK